MKPLDPNNTLHPVTIRYLSVRPEATGEVSSNTWAGASWEGNFTKLAQPDSASTACTSLAMAHDGDRLYIAVKCRGLAGRSAELLASEQVQVLLDPECDGQRAGIVICHPDGLAHAKMVLDTANTDAWTGEIVYGARLGGDEWSLVLTVPLSQFIHRGDGLRRVRFNVVRLPSVAEPESWLSFARLAETEFWLPRHVTVQAEFERPELLAAFAW